MKDSKTPTLYFFRKTPAELSSQDPLASALQSFETCLLLISLDRFPHALMACFSAWESAIKARLNVQPDDEIRAADLIDDIRLKYPALRSYFTKKELDDFRYSRNDIAHFGFSPKDDDVCVQLILKTGFPFFFALMKHCFDFYMDWKELRSSGDFSDLLNLHQNGLVNLDIVGLIPEVADQIRNSGAIYRRYSAARSDGSPTYKQCFRGLSFLIKQKMKDAHIPLTESFTLQLAEERGVAWEIHQDEKFQLHKEFGDPSWEFDCPICSASKILVARLAERELAKQRISIEKCRCTGCGFYTGPNETVTASVLMDRTIQSEQADIFKEFCATKP